MFRLRIAPGWNWVRFASCGCGLPAWADSGRRYLGGCYTGSLLGVVLHSVAFCCGSTRVGPPGPRHPAGVTRRRCFDFMLHPITFCRIGVSGSLTAAVEIVKERGGSRQNTLRRVRGAFAAGVYVSLPDITLSRPWIRAIPSPTDMMVPTSLTSMARS